MVIFIPYVESSLSYKFKLIFTYGIFVGLKSNKHYQVSQAQHWLVCLRLQHKGQYSTDQNLEQEKAY